MTYHPSAPAFAESGEVLSAVDWLGNRFAVGDVVVYCVGAGRGQMMALGVVRALRATPVTRRSGRRAEPGETPTRILDWHDPPTPWIDIETPDHDVTVQVLTACTSGRYDNEGRIRPAWVNPMNVTALHGIEVAATARYEAWTLA